MTGTVKRTADGYASNWLCDHAHPGMRIHVLAPSGNFVPKTLDADYLLLAAGSGITLMMAILKSALAEGRRQGGADLRQPRRDLVIFGAALRELAAKYPDRLIIVHRLETVQGLPTAVALAGLATPYAGHDAFICGPGPFMASAEEALKNAATPTARIHIEVFKSLEFDPFAAVVVEDGAEPPATAIVQLDGEQLPAQCQTARRAARQGPRRAVLLPGGPLRGVRGA